ncbi:1374_t:CDS:2 [Funneliformis mosseae]|uniref:1374_t:CDS:1 n=1 Tax=Funneliformis mosseae TaxID=27381 RepID=A0A9N8ZH80_FUNMO|nr:1374_t:CDS:2 [Funneliformis mosseae]
MSSVHNSFILPPIAINNINDDTNSIDSTNSEIQISENQIQEYQDILKLLADENETIRLTEDLVGRQVTNDVVTNFVSQAAIHLSNRQWIHYGNSTARLELHLRAMSSVLHIFSQLVACESGPAIESRIRESLYKSVSKFWATYRTTKVINANITFSLREIRTCLRKIKDDQSTMSNVLGTTSNILDVILSVMNKEYWAAFGAFIKVLDFEYTAGEWYYDWQTIRVGFFKLRQDYLKCNLEPEKSERITQFYKHLYGLSTEEFKKVKRKNTKFRNFEYKILKSGGSLTGCSLPDHIDTLLIGYLDLIQRMLTEFFLHMKSNIQEIIGFCNEIYESHIKKQLTFKAVEVLYVTRKISKGEEVKNMIKVDFKYFKSRRSTLDSLNSNSTIPPRPLSSPGSIPFFNLPLRNSRNIPFSFTKPSLNPTTLPSYSGFNRESIQQFTPPDTPVSDTSFSSHERKRKSRFSNFRNSIRINSKLREIPSRVSINVQQIRQQKEYSLRNRIVDNVTQLMKERNMIVKMVQEVREINKEIKENHERNNSSQDVSSKDERSSCSSSSRDSLISVKTRNEIPKYITIHNTYYINNDNRKDQTHIEDNKNNTNVDTPRLQHANISHEEKKEGEKDENSIDKVDNDLPKDQTHIEGYKNIANVDTPRLQYDNISNISHEEKKEGEKDENSSDEVDNDLPKVEEEIKYQNYLDNEFTFTSFKHITNEENEPVEIINLIINYQRCDEENHQITINEGVECCYMQHMDEVELEEILSHQKYLEDEHILDNEKLSNDAVVNECVQDLIISTETLKDNENSLIEEEFEELYLDNFEFPITIITSEEHEINDYDQPPPYEELSSSKSTLVNFDEFKKFLLNNQQVDSSNPLWNVDNVKEFEDIYSKTFNESNIQVQYIDFINHIQYDQIKKHNISYNPPPPYEELSSSKSTFDEFKKFLLNHHKVDPSNPLWNVDNLKDFEEMYSNTFNNSKTKDQYIQFINNIQQEIVINIIIKREKESSILDEIFKYFGVEKLITNFSDGHKAAKRKDIMNLSEKN